MDPKKDPAALMDKAQALLASGQEELALEFLQRAHQVEPKNVDALRMLGETQLEVGKVEEGKQSLKMALEIEPNDGGLWMYLGQAESGKEALNSYERGIEIWKASIAEAKSNEEHAEITQHLVCAYCSIAELYMSDLCYEADAEENCEKALLAGLEVSPDNPQALQGLASFKLSQSKPEEAKPVILRAADIVEGLMTLRDKKYAEMMEKEEMNGADEDEVMLEDSAATNPETTAKGETGNANEESEDAMESEDVGDLSLEDIEALLPPFEFRAACARTLVEVNEEGRAASILEKLLEENDEISEVWLLLGRCHAALNNLEDALECFEKATEIGQGIVACDASIANDPVFTNMLQNIQTLKEETEKRIKEAGSNGSENTSTAN